MENKLYKQLNDQVNHNQKCNIVTVFTGKEGNIQEDLVQEVIINRGEGIFAFEPTMYKEAGQYRFLEPVAGKERLIVLGGGHIALPLCEFASKTGFEVTVADDRLEFANRIRFPWAREVVCENFDTALEKISIQDTDYVTIITRGHRYDADCLRNIFDHSNPYYLGMIGSKRRVRGLFDMLEEEGYEREKMNNVHTPIGLSIGAVLPEEIAVSILAELILHKRKENPGQRNIVTDLDLEVIRYLSELKEPSAVVTVMDTKGSTPRGAGAKMVVNGIGKVYGSIGGGCSEQEVVNIARKLIGTGRYRVETIDMTGDVAESEGMVCGGTMEVLIEDFLLT